MPILALLVIGGFALYVMRADERRRVARAVVEGVPALFKAVPALTPRRVDPFIEALRERSPWALVVPAIAVVNVMVFMVTLVGSGGDPEALVAFGANFGPRTTNGEWGRLLVSTFVHAGPLHLIATLAGLVQAGLIVERLVGPAAFSAVYVMSGFLASAVSLWLDPMNVSVGASGAVCGVFGFLAATWIRGVFGASGVKIPLRTFGTLVPAAAVFLLFNSTSVGLPIEAELAGAVAGFVSGLVLTAHLAERKPAIPLVLGAVAATFTIAAAIAVPLYGIIDARPEIVRMVKIEDDTTVRYHAAVQRFRTGSISAKDLARMIERSIVPEVKSARDRFGTLGRVPQQHEALVASAREFLRLREESWELRAAALKAGNMNALRKADRLEMTSLERLASITPLVSQ